MLVAVSCVGANQAFAADENVVTFGNGSGYPGSTGTVTVSLDNDDPISGLQFTLRDIPDSLQVAAINLQPRLSNAGFSSPSFNDIDSTGVVIIVIFGIGSRVEAGNGPVFDLVYQIAPNTPPGTFDIIVDNIVLSNPQAQTVESSAIDGTFDVLPNMTLGDHPVGQIADQFGGPSAADHPLYRFQIVEAGETATIGAIGFTLTGVSGLTEGSFSGLELVEDTNGNGIVDSGESVVGGEGVASIEDGIGTISFSSSFIVPQGTRRYILHGTATLGAESAVTVDLNPENISATGTTAGVIVPVGLVSGVTHTAGSVILSDHAGAGQVPDQIGAPATLTDIPLFRFSLTTTGDADAITDLEFLIDLSQVTTDDFLALSLYEDTNDDGQPDGAATEIVPQVTGATITFNGIDVEVSEGQPRSYVLQGTVVMDQPGDRVSISLNAQGVTVSDAAGNVVPVSGGTLEAVQVSKGLTIADAPQGQVASQFDGSRTYVDIPLFRFFISATGDTIIVTELSFDTGLEGLTLDDLSLLTLFEDTDGDGLADGNPLGTGEPSDIVFSPGFRTSYVFTDLNLAVSPDQGRTFILQGGVDVDTLETTLTLELLPGDVIAHDVSGHTLSATGIVTPAVHASGQITLADATAGQASNQFHRRASATDRDLFRFSLRSMDSTLTVYRIAMSLALSGFSPEALSSFELFEDGSGDGIPDGESLTTDFTITPDSLIVSNLNLTYDDIDSRTFIIRGTVALSHVGEGISIDLAPEGITATIDLPESGTMTVIPLGAVTIAVHEVTGLPGDVNFDLKIDVRDVIKLVRIALGIDEVDGPLELFDLDHNEQINIVDLVAVIRKILHGDSATRPVVYRDDKPVTLMIESVGTRGPDTSEIIVRIESPAPLAGIQLRFASSEPGVEWSEPLLLEKVKGMTIGEHVTDSGLHIIIYSITGQQIPTGQVDLFRIRLPHTYHDPTRFTVEDIIAVDTFGLPVSVVMPNRSLTTSSLPRVYTLHQNIPNPFNPSTEIRYDLPQAGHVTLTVYNLLGQEIVSLVDGAVAAGHYRVVWDGTNGRGQAVASGVYVYRLTAGEGYIAMRKMVLLR